MTTIRAHGFDSPAQLREYLDELDDEPAVTDATEEISGDHDAAAALREVGWLRKEVADLRAELDQQVIRADAARAQGLKTPAWMWLAGALAASFLVTGVTRALVRH